MLIYVKVFYTGRWYEYRLEASDKTAIPYRSKGYRTAREATAAGNRARKRYYDLQKA